MEEKENNMKKQGRKTEKIRTGIVATYYAVDLQRLTAMPRLMPKLVLLKVYLFDSYGLAKFWLYSGFNLS